MHIQGLKYRWLMPTAPQEDIVTVAREHTLLFPVAQTLLTRGFTTAEKIYDYLFCPAQKVIDDAGKLKDAPKAVERILYAIKHKEKILICGDYDVDGVTSTALMMRCLLPLGADINFFLPHRVKDGYGLSVSVIERAAKHGYKVIITVDNGISAYPAATRAHELGLDLIITDHHRPHNVLPVAYAIVNPNQHDCPYLSKNLAGVGVSFKVLSLLYATIGKELPAKAYELLLLGTVADVVPLVGENRYWVRYGLLHINKQETLSLQALKLNAQLTDIKRISSLDVGFLLAPQINALGRLDDARDGVKFLIGDDVAQVKAVAKQLHELNQKRKQLEQTVTHEIIARVARGEINIEKERIILATGTSWPPGVIGLAASRLVGMYGRPTIVLHETAQGIAKGSCRSIVGFDMFAALESASHLLEQFGGHPQAAGLSIKKDNIPAFKDLLEERASNLLTADDLQQKMVVDAQAGTADFGFELMKQLELLEPFGAGNPAPVFYIKQASILQKPKLLKEQHVKCQIFEDGVIKPVIFFNRPELFELLSEREEPLSLLVQPKENQWQGRTTIELTGLDVAL